MVKKEGLYEGLLISLVTDLAQNLCVMFQVQPSERDSGACEVRREPLTNLAGSALIYRIVLYSTVIPEGLVMAALPGEGLYIFNHEEGKPIKARPSDYFTEFQCAKLLISTIHEWGHCIDNMYNTIIASVSFGIYSKYIAALKETDIAPKMSKKEKKLLIGGEKRAWQLGERFFLTYLKDVKIKLPRNFWKLFVDTERYGLSTYKTIEVK